MRPERERPETRERRKVEAEVEEVRGQEAEVDAELEKIEQREEELEAEELTRELVPGRSSTATATVEDRRAALRDKKQELRTRRERAEEKLERARTAEIEAIKADIPGKGEDVAAAIEELRASQAELARAVLDRADDLFAARERVDREIGELRSLVQSLDTPHSHKAIRSLKSYVKGQLRDLDGHEALGYLLFLALDFSRTADGPISDCWVVTETGLRGKSPLHAQFVTQDEVWALLKDDEARLPININF